jgi:two-component sensor histidine kinase
MHFDLYVVTDQAHFTEFVQEEADPGPGRAGHLRHSKDWKLVVADNGIGKPDGIFAQTKSGLGIGIVSALASQRNAKVVTVSGPLGTIVSVTHPTFGSK